jgi:hypothetical protein
MLLLQTDMLAYVAEASDQPTLVIGAGIPPEWLTRPMRANNLPTIAGTVDWTYDGNDLHVTQHAPHPLPVRPGASFAPKVRVHSHHHPT